MKTFGRMLSQIVRNKLPLRIKRLIFISSVFGNTTQKGVDQETLKRLNLVMQLASSEEALGFPVLLSHAIWRGKETVYVNAKSFLNADQEPDFVSCLKQIVESTPNWLRYDSDAGMESDLRQLFNNYELLKS